MQGDVIPPPLLRLLRRCSSLTLDPIVHNSIRELTPRQHSSAALEDSAGEARGRRQGASRARCPRSGNELDHNLVHCFRTSENSGSRVDDAESPSKEDSGSWVHASRDGFSSEQSTDSEWGRERQELPMLVLELQETLGIEIPAPDDPAPDDPAPDDPAPDDSAPNSPVSEGMDPPLPQEQHSTVPGMTTDSTSAQTGIIHSREKNTTISRGTCKAPHRHRPGRHQGADCVGSSVRKALEKLSAAVWLAEAHAIQLPLFTDPDRSWNATQIYTGHPGGPPGEANTLGHRDASAPEAGGGKSDVQGREVDVAQVIHAGVLLCCCSLIHDAAASLLANAAPFGFAPGTASPSTTTTTTRNTTTSPSSPSVETHPAVPSHLPKAALPRPASAVGVGSLRHVALPALSTLVALGLVPQSTFRALRRGGSAAEERESNGVPADEVGGGPPSRHLDGGTQGQGTQDKGNSVQSLLRLVRSLKKDAFERVPLSDNSAGVCSLDARAAALELVRGFFRILRGFQQQLVLTRCPDSPVTPEVTAGKRRFMHRLPAPAPVLVNGRVASDVEHEQQYQQQHEQQQHHQQQEEQYEQEQHQQQEQFQQDQDGRNHCLVVYTETAEAASMPTVRWNQVLGGVGKEKAVLGKEREKGKGQTESKGKGKRCRVVGNRFIDACRRTDKMSAKEAKEFQDELGDWIVCKRGRDYKELLEYW